MGNLVTQLMDTKIKLIYISTKDIYGHIFNKTNVFREHCAANLIKLLTSGSNIKLTNKGKQVRDFLHVYDLGLLIDLIIKSNKKGKK